MAASKPGGIAHSPASHDQRSPKSYISRWTRYFTIPASKDTCPVAITGKAAVGITRLGKGLQSHGTLVGLTAVQELEALHEILPDVGDATRAEPNHVVA